MRRAWIPPGGLLAGFLAQAFSWVLLLALALRGSSGIGFPELAWIHLVTLGWLTMTALSVLIHVIPAFTDAEWRGEDIARGALFVYGAGVAGLVWAFWTSTIWALPWAGNLVAGGLLAYLISALRTLASVARKPGVEAVIARALLLTLVNLFVTAAIGLGLTWALAGRLPGSFLTGAPPVHAAFGIIGWLTLLVMGVSTRTLRPISGARSRIAWAHIAAGTAPVVGLVLLVAGAALDAAPAIAAGAALVVAGSLVYAADVADILRRATVQHRPPQAFVAAAISWLLVGLGLAFATVANVPAGSAAIFVLLIGWIGQMVNAHLYHIGIRLITTMARGDDDETRPGELLAAPLSWASFALFQSAVAAGAIALLWGISSLLAAAALCGLAGWSTMGANVALARRRAIG